MSATEDYTAVARIADVPLGGVLGVELEGIGIALFNVDGRISAIEDLCTHAGAKLSEGPVEGCRVTCPWHHAVFDVVTGEPCGGPAFTAARPCPVRIEGDTILVALPAGEG